ncbi:MAG TPA: antitoxin Xre/MbcA/ParS toxin-binding domain-containing protein [Longimicrobiales bacterium]|nr:antitoxin Xre/MbcA/ParS toxin-binding domain-containing protein [Longimicrobiales bacterium]
MATAARSGIRNVDRYWRNVEQHAKGEHLYVALLGLRTYETVDLHSRIEQGLSYDSLERLQQVLDVPMSELARFVRISPRTLARRKEVGRLQPDESDRLLRLSRLVGLALQLFEGSLEEARSWLYAPNRALGGGSPLEFATTDVGAREVEQLIGRLEHGVAL